MSPEDRIFAREAILRNRLNVEQVTDLTREAEQSGRPFAQVALARGLLTPDQVREMLTKPPVNFVNIPAKSPTWVYPMLIAAALAVVASLLLGTLRSLREDSDGDLQRSAEAARLRTEGDQKSRDARTEYEKKTLEEREALAREALGKARTAMKIVDEKYLDPSTERERYPYVVEATVAYSTYLDRFPDDADVRVERARANELRRDFERARDDLERAVLLKPDLEPRVREKLALFRMLAPKR